MSDPASGPPADPLSAAEAHLLEIIELTRNGKTDTARAAVALETGRFPDALGVLHKAGVIMRFCGDSAAALEFFGRALAVHPRFHYTEIEIADVHAERGEKEEALRWYRQAIDSAPDYPIGYMRAAALEQEFGRSWDGLLLLDELYRRVPTHIGGNVMRAEFLQYHGNRPGAAASYAAAIAAGCDDAMVHFHYMRLLTEIADYRGVLAHAARLESSHNEFLRFHTAVFSGLAKLALASDHGRLVASAAQTECSAAWLTVDALLGRLQLAIRNCTPLSLIRVGDGEARFLAFFDPEARGIVSQQERQCIIDEIWENWFGQPATSTTLGDLESLAATFVASLENADILGVTTAERYARDALHRGYLGVLERIVSAVMARHPEVLLTDSFAHSQLHQKSPFYAGLLSGLDYLGVISPHPGLAARLARYHSIETFQEYVVPGESRLPDTARHRSSGLHFPDRFNQIRAELRVPRRGAVFLVAAGLLGKIYCDHIKQLGGIAVDVGSIVDAWMGYNTRPGQFDNASDWTLPDRWSEINPITAEPSSIFPMSRQ